MLCQHALGGRAGGAWKGGRRLSDVNQIVGAFLPLIILIVIFYFLLWRPQAQEQKKRKAMLESLKKGDEIVTVGGIHGTITALKKDTVIVKIADKVEIELDRSGVGSVRS